MDYDGLLPVSQYGVRPHVKKDQVSAKPTSNVRLKRKKKFIFFILLRDSFVAAAMAIQR